MAPNDGGVMGFIAVGLANLGQLQRAVELYHTPIATDPLRTSVHANLANVLEA